MDKMIPNRCTRCDRKLRPDQEVWLVRNWSTNLYHATEAEVLASENQGGFVFGQDCAAAVMKNGGECRVVAPHSEARRKARA